MPSSTNHTPTVRAASIRGVRFSRRLISFSITSALLTSWIVGGILVGPVNQAEARAGQEDKSVADNQKLLEELDEIDLMRNVGPLKLTPEQVDKIVPVIEKAKTEYDKNINELTTNVMSPLTDEIHTEHKEALKGTPIPKEFDDKVQEKLTNFYTRRDKVNAQNIMHMSEALQKILTEDQQKMMIKLEKERFEKMKLKPGPNDTDDKFYSLYVTEIFIGYPRMVPLLKEIKASGK